MSAPPDMADKEAIRAWWAAAPMTYAEAHGGTDYRHPDGTVETVELGSRRFFELADATFYRWNEGLHGPQGPFSRLFDYAACRGRPVLEVGCGMGCMAMNWALQGARVTAVDLNPVAVAQTRRRFELFGLDGDIREADAEALPFADGTFAYAYSWGVLHHTPGIRRAVAEIHRVLAPGGRVGLMLYNRRSIFYRYLVAYVEGVVNAERCFLDEPALASRYGDGARAEGNPHTWPVTPGEARRLMAPLFRDVAVSVRGTDVPDVLDTWFPRLSRALSRGMREALARRWGWSLWITGVKAP